MQRAGLVEGNSGLAHKLLQGRAVKVRTIDPRPTKEKPMQPTNYQPTADQSLAPDYGPPPAWPYAQPAPTAPVPAKRNRLKAAIGGLALAALLVVGGAATVLAADPTPTPSASSSVTTPDTSPGTTDGTPRDEDQTRADCPDKGTTTTDDTTSTDSSS
jgi:hypothetical protein